VTLIHKDSVVVQMGEEENLSGKYITQIHLKMAIKTQLENEIEI